MPVCRDRKLRTYVVPASFDRCLARRIGAPSTVFHLVSLWSLFWRHTCGVLMKAGVSSSDLVPALLRYLPWRQSVAQDISRHLIFVGRPPAMAWESDRPQSWVALRKCLWEIALPSVSRPQAGPRGLSRYAEVLKCNVVVAGGVLCSYRFRTDGSVVPYRGASSLHSVSRS